MSLSLQQQYRLQVQGMSCASCVAHVEKALTQVKGVTKVTVNLATEQAHVSAAQTVSAQQLITALVHLGYQAQVQQTDTRRQAQDASTQTKWTVIAALLLASTLMLPMLTTLVGITWFMPPVLQLIIAAIVQFGFGARFYKGAFFALKNRSSNMDVLVVLGTSAAFGLSLYIMLSHASDAMPHLYFESSAMVVAFILLGKYFEQNAKKQTSAAIQSLHALRPHEAYLLKNGHKITVPLTDIEPDDLVLVQAGDVIPIDGVIVHGFAAIDQSMLTGESMAVEKKANDTVYAGTVNLNSPLQVRVTQTSQQTVLANIIAQVENAQAIKPPIQHFVDRVSALFVPVVLIIALMTCLVWYALTQDAEHAIMAAVSVLVIACPCALGLATPAAIMVGTGVAAKHGILIPDPSVLDKVHQTTVIALDKTGTLTQGKMRLTHVHNRSAQHSQQDLIRIANALQLGSSHPIARALDAQTQDPLPAHQVNNAQVLNGLGVSATIDHTDYFLGNQQLLQQHIKHAHLDDAELMQQLNQGSTISWLIATTDDRDNGRTSHLLGWFAFEDTLKPDAIALIKALKQRDIQSVMLTGDNAHSAARIAKKLGITDYYAQLMPQQKAEIIQRLQQPDNAAPNVVMMVGDGINDAPALAQADIAVAMGQGTDIAIQSSHITLMGQSLWLIVDSMDITHAIWRKIRQNLFWAFIYNVIGIPLAALGLLNPMVAGLAMALSSVSVLMNSLLLRSWHSKRLKANTRHTIA